MDVVVVREPLETGEPVRLSVGALPEALHDVDDLVISYASAVEWFDDGVALSDVLIDGMCLVCVKHCVVSMCSVCATGTENKTRNWRNKKFSSVFANCFEAAHNEKERSALLH